MAIINIQKEKLYRTFPDKSFVVFSMVWIILLTFNTCERPERMVQVKTLEALPADISFNTAILKGEITDVGSDPVDDHGIMYSPNPTPNIGNSIVISLGKCSSRGDFQVNAENLTFSTIYYFRAFVNVNGKDIYPDDTRQFKTKNCIPATITTTTISFIKSSSAFSGGNISDDGGAPVTSRGVCWNITPDPDITADKTIDGTGSGVFTSSITGLTDKTTYHVRAYATNLAGTSYGADVSFTTSGFPTVATTPVNSLTSISVVAGGDVTSEGDGPVTERGVCWSTTINPAVYNNHISNGSGTGTFSCDISGLTPGTTYHLRAYAINMAGLAYGEDRSFTTLNLPTILTSDITALSSTTVISGGNVTSDGGTTVTERGVCWNTADKPTIDNPHKAEGGGLGTFSCDITGLIPGTTYHLRAYATNSTGTAYGEEKLFTTHKLPALSTTIDLNSVTSTSVISRGNITSDGGTPVIVRGVCWGTTPNPTIAGLHSSNDGGQGSFSHNITGLTPGTKYYVCAYATNSVGTAYGNVISLTTLNLPSITTTIDFPSITSTTVTSGGNIISDGGATVTARGVCWSITASPTTDNMHSVNGSGPGSFIHDITGLITGTTYHVRAYATNSVGTAYGSDLQFTTLCIPDIFTSEVSSVTPSSATSGGDITSGCGAVVTARGICWSLKHAPSIEDIHTAEGSGTGSYASNLYGLSSGTVYYLRAYATTSLGTTYGNELSFITPVADISGNIYKTTVIGSQIWMAENLKTTKLNNGTNIPLVTDSIAWSALLTPGYCWYNNDEPGNKTYGPLYNWYTVSTGNLCPFGWHVPDNTDVTVLTDFMGGIIVAGGRLKETGTTHWITPNTAATDEFNFTGIPGGSRGATGAYGNIGKYGYWWVNTPHPFDPEYAWGYVLSYISAEIIRANYYYKKDGFSVRCVHD